MCVSERGSTAGAVEPLSLTPARLKSISTMRDTLGQLEADFTRFQIRTTWFNRITSWNYKNNQLTIFQTIFRYTSTMTPPKVKTLLSKLRYEKNSKNPPIMCTRSLRITTSLRIVCTSAIKGETQTQGNYLWGRTSYLSGKWPCLAKKNTTTLVKYWKTTKEF